MTEPHEDNPTATVDLVFEGETVQVVLEFHLSDNAEDFIDVPEFVNLASTAVLRALTGL